MSRRFAISHRRLLGGALLASLTVNAFFIGAAATDVLRTTVADGPAATARSASLFRYDWRWLDDRLPDDAMAKIISDVGRGGPGAEARFEHLEELRTSLGILVAAPQPDRAAIDTKLQEIRRELNRLLAETQATTITSVLSLPAQTRTSLGP